MTAGAATRADGVGPAAQQLDAHVREIVKWHFTPETGTPRWLDWAETNGRRPAEEMDNVIESAGLATVERLVDEHGLFTVGLAQLR